MFSEVFVEHLRKVIEAYQPVSQTTTWMAVLEGIEGDAVLPVLSCNGDWVLAVIFVRDSIQLLRVFQIISEMF